MKIEINVKYTIAGRNGKQKQVSESYLVYAISYAEAEALISEYMHIGMINDFEIKKMQVAKYSEVISGNDGNNWFKIKIVTEDDSEKKTIENILIFAANSKDAIEIIIEHLHTWAVDYEITNIAKSQIVDVIKSETDA